MSYNYCKDHRSGITYVYEVEKKVDGSTGEIKNVRSLIGKLDEKGNVVPTSGRRGRLPKTQVPESTTDEAAKDEIKRLKKETEDLKDSITMLQKNQREIISGLEKLLTIAKNQAMTNGARKVNTRKRK